MAAFVLLRALNVYGDPEPCRRCACSIHPAPLGVVLALYPFSCRWFAAVKQRRGDWWLSYL
jgi:hypothetical protein